MPPLARPTGCYWVDTVQKPSIPMLEEPTGALANMGMISPENLSTPDPCCILAHR